jgi:hypothetical protein
MQKKAVLHKKYETRIRLNTFSTSFLQREKMFGVALVALCFINFVYFLMGDD